MFRRTIFALTLALVPTLSLAQSYGTQRFDAIVVGGFTINGVGTTAGTVAAGNDSRIVGAVQTGSAASLGSLALSTPLSLSQGGCGATTALGCLTNLSIAGGTSGQVLTSNGPGTVPTYQPATGGGGGNVSTSGSPVAGQLAQFATGTTIQGLTASFGQVRLTYSSTTALLVNPYAGNLVTINGVPRVIPSAGVTCSNSGLSASTLYYEYLYVSGSTVTCESVTTAHATDAGTGIEIKSGDSTRTLVGMAYTDASGLFQSTAAVNGVASWFNRAPKLVFAAASGGSTGSSTTSEYPQLRVQTLVWGDDLVDQNVSGFGYNSSAGFNASIYSWLSGAQQGQQSVMTSAAANAGGSLSLGWSFTQTEGMNVISVGVSTNGGSAFFSLRNNVRVRG